MVRNAVFVVLTLAGVALIVSAAWMTYPPVGMLIAGLSALVMARSIAGAPPDAG